MSRLTTALLDQKAFSNHSNQPMLNLAHGGQHGWAPNLTEWVSNQAYVRKNLVPILLEAPRFFQLMPDSGQWYACLKSLIELHCRTIDGFKATLTVETDDHPVGGAGEIQEEFVNVKRERSAPTFTFIEKYGLPIQTFLENWIRYGLMDPETKYAMVGTLPDARGRITDMLADNYSMTCLFFEPDPTHTKVIKSWITTNMYPKTTGEIIGKRDLTANSELLELQVDFTGISQYNLGSNKFAQKILDSINMTDANPYLRPAFISQDDANLGIDPDVAGNNGVNGAGSGYIQEMNILAASAVANSTGLR